MRKDMEKTSSSREDFRSHSTEVLNRLFWSAFRTKPFDAICTVLRVGGMSDADWDPLEESRRAFDDYNWMLQKAVEERSNECQRRIGLLMYCQAVEMTAPHEIIANLLRCLNDEPYQMSPFRNLGRHKKKELFSWIPPSATAKIREIRRIESECEQKELISFFDGFFDEKLRNAFSHSDYVLTDEYFRYTKAGLSQQITVAELDKIIAACFDFYGPFLALHRTWLRELAKLQKYHKWPNYEVLEFLSTEEEGLYGFNIHFSNGSKATYTRRASGIEAINLRFEKGGTINFFCGLIDDLEPIWKIDGKPMSDWNSVNKKGNA